MNKKSLSQLNSRQKRKSRLKRLIALFSAIAVFVTTYALILPAITIDDETAENEPGLDVVQTIEDTEDTGELISPPSEPEEAIDDISRSASCGDLTVGAELTDGSFGESVVMELTAVSDENVLNAAVAAVDGIEYREADKVRAVEISFTDENGEDGTPDAPMNLTLYGEAISGASDPVIVRVDGEGNAEVVENGALAPDFVYLEGESDSIYAIVETHEITTRYLTADGQYCVITLKYDTTAGIPDGSELQVAEVTDEALYEQLLANAYAYISADRQISDARFFDISIIYNGAEIEPLTPVEVTVEYEDQIVLEEDNELFAIHFADTGVEFNSDVTLTENDKGGTTLTFEQDGFSYTGTLVTGSSNLANNTKYLMIVQDGNDYYAMNSSGSGVLIPVTFDGTSATINTTADDPDSTLLWTYNNNTLRNASSGQYIYMGNSLMSNTSRSLTFNNGSNGGMTVSYRNGSQWYGTTYYLAYTSSSHAFSRGNSSNAANVFFVRYNPTYKVRVHYIDRDGNEISTETVTTVPYTETPAIDIHNQFALAIPGYTFEEARYGDEFGDRVQYIQNQTDSSGNIIAYFKNPLQYDTDSGAAPLTTNYNNTALAANIIDGFTYNTSSPNTMADVYMVYTPDNAPGPNDHGQEIVQDENEFPFGAPDHNKRLEPNYTDGNWDGTYTLYLDVTGNGVNESTNNKADIILIYDTSNSMHQDDIYDENGNHVQVVDPSTNRTHNKMRYEVAYGVVEDVAQELYANNVPGEEPAVRIGVVSFASTARTEFSYVDTLAEFDAGFAFAGQESSYQRANNGIGGGTNWEDALKVAMEMYEDPTNGHRADAEQYIIFVSDGEPTCRYTKGDWYKLQHAAEYTMSNNVGSYDQDPTNNNRQHYGHGYSTMNDGVSLTISVEHCYTQAKDDARAFVEHQDPAKFYAVGVFNAPESLARMNTLTNYAYTGLDYPDVQNERYVYADNEQVLHDKFAGIIYDITRNFSYGDVGIMDQMTATSLTTGEISGAGNAVDFKYYKNPAGGTLTEWQGAPTATYDPNTRSVDWDLSSVGVLEDGVTYTVGFTVWPDQDAYDAIMLLNDLVDANVDPDEIDAFAASQYPSIAPLLRKDGSGHYIIQSNADALLTYERLITQNGETVSLGPESAGYSYPNMETTTYHMKVSKYWQDSLQSTNRFQSVTFAVYEDYDDTPGATNTPYTYVTLDASNTDPNDPNAWISDDIEISPGIFKTEIDPDNPINPGHVYTVKEIAYTDRYGEPHNINNPEDYTDYRYEFNPEDVTPMLYDGVMTYMGDANEDQRLTGVNALRGGINLYKVVLGRDGEPIYTDDEYEFIFNYTVPERFVWGHDDVTGDPIYDPNAVPLWYTMYTDNDYDGDYFGVGDTNSVTNGLPDLGGGWGTLSDGDHVKIKANQMIRIINVPIGTEFSFDEINVPPGWSFDSALIQIEDTIVEQVSGPTNGQNIIEGTAVSDAAHEVAFFNTMTHYEVKVHKVDEDDNTVVLPGAVFSIYTAPGQDPNDIVTINGQTQFTTDVNGDISLGIDFPNGTYYLYEVSPPPGYQPLTSPIVVTVADSGVTYSQPEQADGATQTAPLTPGATAPIYTVTAINEPQDGGVQIIKVDSEDPTVTLQGAVFNLYRAPDGVDEEDLINSTTGIVDKTLLTAVEIDGETDLESNANGVIPLGDTLPPGVYYLFEITPPTGYAAPKDPVKITVSQGGTVMYSQKDYNAGQTMTATLASSGNDPPALTIYVANGTGITLPHTGGSGTLLYTLGGITLMCIAALMLGIELKRKRRERRNE